MRACSRVSAPKAFTAAFEPTASASEAPMRVSAVLVSA
jgi:hypothetical protein